VAPCSRKHRDKRVAATMQKVQVRSALQSRASYEQRCIHYMGEHQMGVCELGRDL